MPLTRNLALIAVAVLALGACGDDDTDAPSASAGGGEDDGAAPSELTVDIVDFEYATPEITVAPGSTITFTNSDDAAHTATARGEEFNTGSIAGGETMSVTVGDSGTIEYFCSFHPFMEGEVVIE